MKIGTVYADLAVLRHADRTEHVLVMTGLDRQSNRIYVAIPLPSKAKADVVDAVMMALLNMEWIYGMDPIVRVHCDRENAMIANRMNVVRRAIKLTLTTGNDPAANGKAEAAIASQVRNISTASPDAFARSLGATAFRCAARRARSVERRTPSTAEAISARWQAKRRSSPCLRRSARFRPVAISGRR